MGGSELVNLFVPMTLTIVTSRFVRRGILLSFENGAGDALDARATNCLFFKNRIPYGLFSCRIYIFVRLCFNKGKSFFYLTYKSNWKSSLKCLNTVLDRKVMRETDAIVRARKK